MVRAFEARKEEEVKALILSKFATVMGTNGCAAALEYFEHLLAYYRRFEHADMRILAALAIRLALKAQNTPVNMEELLKRLSVPAHPKMDSFIEISQKEMIKWGKVLMLARITEKLPH
jgi:hypothetical protein